MPVIEAQYASILVPHDHRHINHETTAAADRGVPDRPILRAPPDSCRNVATAPYRLLCAGSSRRWPHSVTARGLRFGSRQGRAAAIGAGDGTYG